MVRMAEILKAQHPTQFINVYNSTANAEAVRFDGGGIHTYAWKSQKVNVRFAQSI